MIELERHIEILLLSNDCVIVPNLGGFMTHHVEARYDEAEQLFLPPLRTLGFNPQLTMNDSLLVQSYVEAYDISYPEALRRIEGEVAELRQHLETNGEYVLNDIGILRLNEEGHMEFEPCEAGILTPELYGLSSFEMQLISENGKLSTDQGAIPSSQHKHREEPAIIIKMAWLRNAAAIAAAIVTFFFLQTPISNSNVMTKEQLSSVIPVTTSNKQVDRNVSLRPTTSETKPETVLPQPSPEPAEAPIPESERLPQSKPQPSFCIVLASQTTHRLAEDFIDRMKKGGHDEVRMINMQNSKKVRVVYGFYPSEQDAYEKLRQMRKLNDFKDAWVLKLTPVQ